VLNLSKSYNIYNTFTAINSFSDPIIYVHSQHKLKFTLTRCGRILSATFFFFFLKNNNKNNFIVFVQNDPH